jgi:hypothetical protein
MIKAKSGVQKLRNFDFYQKSYEYFFINENVLPNSKNFELKMLNI